MRIYQRLTILNTIILSSTILSSTLYASSDNNDHQPARKNSETIDLSSEQKYLSTPFGARRALNETDNKPYDVEPVLETELFKNMEINDWCVDYYVKISEGTPKGTLKRVLLRKDSLDTLSAKPLSDGIFLKHTSKGGIFFKNNEGVQYLVPKKMLDIIDGPMEDSAILEVENRAEQEDLRTQCKAEYIALISKPTRKYEQPKIQVQQAITELSTATEKNLSSDDDSLTLMNETNYLANVPKNIHLIITSYLLFRGQYTLSKASKNQQALFLEEIKKRVNILTPDNFDQWNPQNGHDIAFTTAALSDANFFKKLGNLDIDLSGKLIHIIASPEQIEDGCFGLYKIPKTFRNIHIIGNEKVRSVGNSFLSWSDNLKSVGLSGFNSVTSIGDGFLSYCCSLTLVDLSNMTSVTSVGDWFLGAGTLYNVGYCYRLDEVSELQVTKFLEGVRKRHQG